MYMLNFVLSESSSSSSRVLKLGYTIWFPRNSQHQGVSWGPCFIRHRGCRSDSTPPLSPGSDDVWYQKQGQLLDHEVGPCFKSDEPSLFTNGIRLVEFFTVFPQAQIPNVLYIQAHDIGLFLCLGLASVSSLLFSLFLCQTKACQTDRSNRVKNSLVINIWRDPYY